MRASDVMTTAVATIAADATVRDAARTMVRRRISALPVLGAGGRVIGVISEGDLVRRAELGTENARSWWLRLFDLGSEDAAAEFVRTHGQRVRDVMTRPVISVTAATPLEKVALLLEKHRIKRVPVLRSGRLVGIVSRADLVRRLAAGPRPKRAGQAADRILLRRVQGSVRASGIDATYVNVQVSHGVLHLWGSLKSGAEKRALRVAAEAVPGVRRIEDHTGVLSAQTVALLGAE